MGSETIGNNPRLQSPFIYLQAAGSDGSDETSIGIHLRWAMQGSVGKNHLPKGDNAAPGAKYETSIGFNRGDDYVRVFKAPYNESNFSVYVDLAKPTSIVDGSGPDRAWIYYGYQPVSEDPAVTSGINVHFVNVALYDLVRATVDPHVDPLGFLYRYDDTLRIEAAAGKHLLNICVLFEPVGWAPSPGPLAWGEAVATRTRTLPEELYVSCRAEVFAGQAPQRMCFTCEDVDHIRFRYKNAVPFAVRFQTYEDYTQGVFPSATVHWTPVGSFALTLDDVAAENALRNAPHHDVDKKWPKYNEADPATGAFTVRATNYLDRWSKQLRGAVERYFDLSRADLEAKEVVTDPSTQPNEAAVEVSYLDSLKIVAQDFHAARMLGLGTIDHDPDTLNRGTVYLVVYVTEAALGLFSPPQYVTHYYLTPPVKATDHRLPPVPKLLPPRYGLSVKPIENEPEHWLTDANGYTKYEPSRWIHLDREPFDFEKPLQPFWSGDKTSCLCSSTLCAMYGIEYRKQGEPQWRRPEISHDTKYADAAGLRETIGAIELRENPIFTHCETEEGVHQYAAYSINWFSRVSPLSNVITTDETEFPLVHLLQPPSQFAVQLVQAENPLIFTTAAEQAQLAALAGPDETLVRVTFEWNQAQNASYAFADHVELFFRDTLPEQILGQISTAANAIEPLANHRLRIRTEPQIVSSSNPQIVREPFLALAQKSRYVGGNFAAGGRSYVIDNVEFPNASGKNPSFVVRQIRETATLEGLNGELITTESWAGPSTPGQPFAALENLTPPSNWDAKLGRNVYLEPFHEVWQVSVVGSANNDRAYTVAATTFTAGQTRITLREPIASNVPPFGQLVFRRRARIVAADAALSQIRVAGDLTAAPGGLAVGNAVRIFGASANAGSYSVAAVSFASGETSIEVAPPLPESIVAGYVDYEKHLSIAAVDQANRRFHVAGNHVAELRPPRIEGERVIGGMSGNATIAEILDNGARTGAFEIVFDALTLPDHVDPSVEWYRGTVRVLEDASLIAPGSRPARRKVLNIWELDRGGATLRVVAFDPKFDPAFDPANGPFDPNDDYVPIDPGAAIDVNIHPGYRLYLLAEGAFNESAILPNAPALSRKTLMTARSIDSRLAGVVSHLAPPAILLAQGLKDPVPPGVPTGPLFATRPDFYGKATYTFDVNVDEPYSLVFYRGTDRAILDALYKRETVAQILADLASLDPPDADFVNDRWRDLVGGVTDATQRFKQYVPGGYRFPTPDNTSYTLPHPTEKVHPFDGVKLPGAMIDAVHRAIEGAFVPLTEQPLIYDYLKTGTTTSNRPPIVRDSAGNVLLPGDAEYDPWPMAVRLPDGDVRFTDYTLDGAATNRYFYFGMELSNRMTRSERGPIAGPIALVNSAPPPAPAIRDVHVRTANPVRGQRAAVVFTVNPYLAVEGVVAYRIYRAFDASVAQNVRDMQLATMVALGEEAVEEVADDFSDLEMPPFGDPLFYRIVALRRFRDENEEEELAPSFPSVVRQVQLIDDVVPPAPSLAYSFSQPQPGVDIHLPDVTLTWLRTAWKPRYHVYKMNVRGNWVKVHTLTTNAETVTLDLAQTTLATNVLPKKVDGRTLYHRFKVVTENSSGLLSREERPLVI